MASTNIQPKDITGLNVRDEFAMRALESLIKIHDGNITTDVSLITNKAYVYGLEMLNKSAKIRSDHGETGAGSAGGGGGHDMNFDNVNLIKRSERKPNYVVVYETTDHGKDVMKYNMNDLVKLILESDDYGKQYEIEYGETSIKFYMSVGKEEWGLDEEVQGITAELKLLYIIKKLIESYISKDNATFKTAVNNILRDQGLIT